METDVNEKNETVETTEKKSKPKRKTVVSLILSVAVLLAIAVLIVYLISKPGDDTVKVMEEIESANAFSNEAYSELIEIQSEYDLLPENEKKKVKNYDDLGFQFMAYCTKLSSLIDSECAELDIYSYDVLLEYKDEYEKLSDEHKALVTNSNLIYDNLEEAKRLQIQGKIDELKSSTDTELIKTLIEENRADFTQEQLLDCAKHLARWEGFDKVEEKLKKALKNPYSYILSSGTSSVSVSANQDIAEYSCYVNIKYSATNSFGGRISDSMVGFAYFDLTDDGYIIWKEISLVG